MGLVTAVPTQPSAAPALSGTGSSGAGGLRVGDPGFRQAAVALFVAGVATFALLYAPQPLLPLLAADFNVSPAAATLTISLSTLALGVTMIIAAAISDRTGRTKLMIGSLLSASAIGLATAAAPSWNSLLALRLLEGVALAGLPAVAMAYLRDEVHPEAHARATGLYIGGTALGGMLGRILSGLLADLGGWRVATAGIGLLGLACAATVIVLLPPSQNFVPQTGRRRGQLGILLSAPMLPLYAIGGLMMGSFVAVYNAMSFRLAAAPYLLSAGVAGLVFCVYPVGSVGSALAGRIADRVGRAQVVLIGIAVTALGVLLTLGSALLWVVLGLGVMTGGFFAAHGVASGWVTARAHRIGAPVGMAASFYLFSYYLGSSIFGSLAGARWTADGWSGVVEMSLLLISLSAGLTLLAWRHSPAR
ncbi:MFS transporter, YNFM family, putative membrane transport protein [Frankineae bacterium MT45]|nr:MFS transporter, YNFM family, putative membrane transport protein [Frankineae bacterium MT45]